MRRPRNTDLVPAATISGDKVAERKPARRKDPKRERDEWFIIKDKILVSLGVLIVVGTFVWAVWTGETHLEWLGFAVTLFTIFLAAKLDRQNRE
jgi:hypothetical protein